MTPPAPHTPGPDFTKHLFALQERFDKVQPLADYRGNFAALHAICEFCDAVEVVVQDLAPFSERMAQMAAAPEMLAFVRRFNRVMRDWDSGNNDLTLADLMLCVDPMDEQARALLARIEGKEPTP